MLYALIFAALQANGVRASQYGTRIISPLQGSTVKRTALTHVGQTVYANGEVAVRLSAIFDNDFTLGESGIAKISMCVEKFHVDTQTTSCEWAPAVDGDGGATKTIHANGDKEGFYSDDGYYHWEGAEQTHMLRAQITGNTIESFKNMAVSTRVRVAISIYHADDLNQSLDDTNNPNVLDLVTSTDGTVTLRGTVVSFVVSSELETDFGSALVEYGIKDDHDSIDHEFRSSFTLDRVSNQASIKFSGTMPSDLTNEDWKDYEAYVNLDLESEQGVIENDLTVSMNRWAHDPHSATADTYKPNCNMTVEFWVRPVEQADCSSALIHIDHTLSIIMCGDALKEPGTAQSFGSLSEKSRYGRRVSTSQMSGLPTGDGGLSVHAIVYSKDGDAKGQVFENVIGASEELSVNAWTHLAFVRQNEHCAHEDFGFYTDRWGTKSGDNAVVGRSGSFIVYVNGRKTFEKSNSPRGFGFLANKDDFAADEAPYLRLGAGLNGYIDDVRIWSSARSSEQIKDNLLKTASARALAQEYLAAYWTFDASYANTPDGSYYRGKVAKPASGNVQEHLPEPTDGPECRYVPDQTSIYSEECKYDESPNVPRHCTGVGGKDKGTQAHTLRDIKFHKGLTGSPSISMGTKKRLSEGTWRFTVGTSYVPNKAQQVDFHSFRNLLTDPTDKTMNHESKIRYPGSCSNRIRMDKNDVAWSTLWQNPCDDQTFSHARKCKQRFGENDYLYAGKASNNDNTYARSDGWIGSIATIDKRLSDLNRNEYHDPNAHWSTVYYTKDMSLSELADCRVCDSNSCRTNGGSPQTEELAVTKTDNGDVIEDIVLLYTFENMEGSANGIVVNDAPGQDSTSDAQLCNQDSASTECAGSSQHVYGTAFKGHVSARVPTTVGETNSLFYRIPKTQIDAFPGTQCSTDPTTCDGAFSMWLRWKPGVLPSGYFMTSYADDGDVRKGWQGFFHSPGNGKRYIVFTAPHNSGYLFQSGQATGIESDPSSVPGNDGNRPASERAGGAVFADVTDQTSQNGWMHVTVTWLVGAYMSLYVNGEQTASNVPRSNSGMSLDLQSATSNKFMCVGGCAQYSVRTYTMMPDVYFDDYRLFDRALRQDEAMDMYLSSSFYRGKISSRLVTKLSDDETANEGASEELYSFASYQFGISMLGSYGSVSLFQARTFDFQAEFRSATFSDDNHLLLTVDTYVRHLDSTYANMRTTKLGSAMVVSFPDTTKDGEFESWGHAGQPTQEFWFNADVEMSGRDPNFYCKFDTAGTAPGPVNCPFDFDLVSPETVTCQNELPLDRPDSLAGKTADDYCYQRWTLRTGMNGDTGSKAKIPSIVTDFIGKIPLRFSQMWKSSVAGPYEKRGGDEYLEVTLTVDVRRSALDEELSGNQMSSFSAKRSRTYADINMQQERNSFVRGENVYADLRLDIPGVDSAGGDFWNDERNWWTLHVTEASVCANVDPSAVPRPYDSFNTGSTGCNTPGFVENKLVVFAQSDNQLPTSADLATDSNLPNHDLRSSVAFDDLLPADDDSVVLPSGATSSVSSVSDTKCNGDVCVGIVLSNANAKAYRLNRDTSVAALFAGDARAKIGVSSVVVGASSPSSSDKSALRIRVEDPITNDQPAATDTWSEHIGWSGTGSIAMWYQVIDASQAGILSSGEGNHFRLWTQDLSGEHVIRFAPWGESDDGFWAPAEVSLTKLGLESNDWIHVIATWDWGAGCSHQAARAGACEVNVGLHINGGDEARTTAERSATPEIRRTNLVSTVEAGGSAPNVVPVVPDRHPMFHWPSNPSNLGATGGSAGALYIPSTTENISPSDETTWIAVDDFRLFLHSTLSTDHAQMLYTESSLAASGLPSKFYGLTGAFNSKVIDRRYFDWSSETGISFPVAPLVTDGSNLFLEMRYSVTVNDDIYYKPSDHAFELMTEMLGFDGAGLVNRRRVGVAHFSFEHDLLDIHPPGANIGSIEFSSWQGRVGNYWIPKYTRSHHLQGLALRVDSHTGGYGCVSAIGDNSQICGPEETAGDQAWRGFYAVPVPPTDDSGNSGSAWSTTKGAVCLWARVNSDACGKTVDGTLYNCNDQTGVQRLRQRVFTVFDKSEYGVPAIEIYLQPVAQNAGKYHVFGVVDGIVVHTNMIEITVGDWVHTCVSWKDGRHVELFLDNEKHDDELRTTTFDFIAGGLGNANADAECDNNAACLGYDGAFFVGLPRVVDGVSDVARLQMFDVDDIRIFSEPLTKSDVEAIMMNTAGDHIAFFSDVELEDPILGTNLVAHTATNYDTCSNTELRTSDDCGFRIVADIVLDPSDMGGVIVSRISQGSADIDTKAAYHMTISENWSKAMGNILTPTRTLKACVGTWLSEAFSDYASATPQSDQVLCASVDFDASDVGGQMHTADASTTSGVILRLEMTYTRKFTDVGAKPYGTDSLTVRVAERDRDPDTPVTASATSQLPFGFESPPASSAAGLAGTGLLVSSGKRPGYLAGPGERTHIGTHYSDSVGAGTTLDIDKSINTFQGRIAHMSFYSTSRDPIGTTPTSAIAVYNDEARGTQAYFEFDGRRESALLTDQGPHNVVGNLLNFNQRGQLQLPGKPSGYFTGETRFKLVDMEGGVTPGTVPTTFWVRLSVGTCAAEEDETENPDCPQNQFAPVGSMWGAGGSDSPAGRYAAQIDTASASWKYDTVILYRAHGTSGSPSAPITANTEGRAWVKLRVDQMDSNCLYASGWCSNVYLVNSNTRVRIVGKSHIGVVDTRALDAKYLPNLGSQGDTAQAYPTTYGKPYEFDASVMIPAHVEDDITSPEYTQQGVAPNWNSGLDSTDGASDYTIESISSIPVAILDTSNGISAENKLPSTFSMPMVDASQSHPFSQNDGFTVCGLFRFSGARCNDACKGGQRLISVFGAKTTSAVSEHDGSFTYAGNDYGDANRDAFSNLFLRCEDNGKSRFVEIQHDPNISPSSSKSQTNVIVYGLMDDQAFGVMGGTFAGYHQICWERQNGGNSAISVDGDRFVSAVQLDEMHDGLSSASDWSTSKAYLGQSVGMVAGVGVLYNHIGVLMLGGYGNADATVFSGSNSNADISSNWIVREVSSAHIVLPGKVKDVVAWTWGREMSPCPLGTDKMHPYQACSVDGGARDKLMFWMGPSRMDQFAYTSIMQDVAWRCATDAIAQITSDTTQYTDGRTQCDTYGYNRVLKSAILSHENKNDGFKHPGYSKAYYVRNIQSDNALYPTVAGQNSAASALCVASSAIVNISAVGGQLGAAAPVGPIRSSNLKVFLYPQRNAFAEDAGTFANDGSTVSSYTSRSNGAIDYDYLQNNAFSHFNGGTEIPVSMGWHKPVWESTAHPNNALPDGTSPDVHLKLYDECFMPNTPVFEQNVIPYDLAGMPSKFLTGGSYMASSSSPIPYQMWTSTAEAYAIPTNPSLVSNGFNIIIPITMPAASIANGDKLTGFCIDTRGMPFNFDHFGLRVWMKKSSDSEQRVNYWWNKEDNTYATWDGETTLASAPPRTGGFMYTSHEFSVTDLLNRKACVLTDSEPDVTFCCYHKKFEGTTPYGDDIWTQSVRFTSLTYDAQVDAFRHSYVFPFTIAAKLVSFVEIGISGTFSRVRELACDSSGGEVDNSVARCTPTNEGQFASTTHNPYTWSMQACVNYDTSPDRSSIQAFEHLTDGVKGSNEDALHLFYTDHIMSKLGYSGDDVANTLDIWKPADVSVFSKYPPQSSGVRKFVNSGVVFACNDQQCSNGPTSKQKLQSPMGQSVRFAFEEPEPKTAEPHNTNPEEQDVDGSFTYCASFRMIPAADKADCSQTNCKAAWATDFNEDPPFRASYANEGVYNSESSSGSAQGQYYMTSSEVLRVKNMFKDDDGVWQDAILGVSKDANNGYSMTVAYMDAGAENTAGAVHLDSASQRADARRTAMGSSRYTMHELPFVGSDHGSVSTNPTSSTYWDPYYTESQSIHGVAATDWPMCAYDDPDCDPSHVTPWVDGTLSGGQNGADNFEDVVGLNAAENTRLVGCIRLDCANHGAFSYHLYGEHGGEIGHTRWGPESNDVNYHDFGYSSTSPHFQDYCTRNNVNSEASLPVGSSRLQNPDGSDPPREYLFGDSQGAGGPDNQLYSTIWQANNAVGARVGPGGTATAWATDTSPVLHHQWQVMPASGCNDGPWPHPNHCMYVPTGGSTVQSLVTQFRYVQLYDRALSESEMAGLAKSENEFNVVSQKSQGPIPIDTSNVANRYPGSTQNTNADYSALRSGRGRPSRIGAHGLDALKKRAKQLRSAPRTGGQMVAIKRAVSADAIVEDRSEFSESGNGDGFGYTAFTVSCPPDRPHFHSGNRTCQHVTAYVTTHNAPSLPDAPATSHTKTPSEAIQEMENEGASVRRSGSDLSSAKHNSPSAPDMAHMSDDDHSLPTMDPFLITGITIFALVVIFFVWWWVNSRDHTTYTTSTPHCRNNNKPTYHRVPVCARREEELPKF